MVRSVDINGPRSAVNIILTDVLARVKEMLSAVQTEEGELLDILSELLDLVDQFSTTRSKADRAWLPRALDTLDREGTLTALVAGSRAELCQGTNMWNLANAVQPSVDARRVLLTAKCTCLRPWL